MRCTGVRRTSCRQPSGEAEFSAGLCLRNRTEPVEADFPQDKAGGVSVMNHVNNEQRELAEKPAGRRREIFQTQPGNVQHDIALHHLPRS